MSKIRAALSCNLDRNLLAACLPLLESGTVEALEWSFDALYKWPAIPDWFANVLKAFAAENRLIGHGIYYSILSGKTTGAQAAWLAQLEKIQMEFQFEHVTEHFGFMTGEDFHKGAPMPVPLTDATLAIGRQRLMRLAQAAKCPVGLENLAFAFSLAEVKRQGEFLEKLLSEVNGFILLDLHNLYCQVHNFGIEFEDLLACYPLELVREIHISGGSWQDSTAIPGKRIRRDTHDDRVPAAVFEYLEMTIDRCPNLKYVTLEQMGFTLASEPAREGFREDFLRMNDIVQVKNERREDEPGAQPFLPVLPARAPGEPEGSAELDVQQAVLTEILETAESLEAAQRRLAASGLGKTAWQVEEWAPDMIETAMQIARKWKDGFQ